MVKWTVHRWHLASGEYFAHSLQHTETLVVNNKFHTVQTSATEPLKKTDPAGLVLTRPTRDLQTMFFI